jgi:hypothetical protein
VSAVGPLAPDLWFADRPLKLRGGDRVIVPHGQVLESEGRERFAAAFAFL